MNYKSNLEQPDIWHHFKHVHFRPQGQSFGHDVPSDWADKADDDPIFGIWKRCGSLTHDEGAILAACARQYKDYPWGDIGCNTGMSSLLIHDATKVPVTCVDYMLGLRDFWERFKLNTGFGPRNLWPVKSDEYFDLEGLRAFGGFLIDGDHDRPQPLKDAQNASKHLAPDGVIVMHDLWGEPVQDAVTWLMYNGFKARIYKTPHGVAVCWRGNYFKPPEHVPDPALPDLFARCPKFDFERCV